MDNNTYNSNMIKSFIFRIDFVSDIEELKDSIPDNLTSIITKYFPNSIMTDVVESQINIQKDKIQKTDKPFKQWEYVSSDNVDKIVITPKTLLYECNKYISFQNVLEKFESIIKEMLTFKNVQVGRLGIRYINVFEAKKFEINKIDDWDQYFVPNITNFYHFDANNNSITNMVNSIEYSYGDFRIKYKNGFNNKHYPLIINKPDFIIDCDGYSNAVTKSYDDLKETIDAIHDEIEVLFEKSITEKLRGKLNG